MFLAAAPYFRRRFEKNPWALEHYESSILSVSTITNLLCVLVLAKLQQNASYPIRIAVSLVILTAVFALQAMSTVFFRAVPVGLYFIFVMTMVLGASFAVGMNQNGVFAYVSGFGRPEYTQAIMAGQGIAGVLPCIVQIITNAAGGSRRHDGDHQKNDDGDEFYKSALTYFLFAVLVTLVALFSFVQLMSRTAGPRWFIREFRAIQNAHTMSDATNPAPELPAPTHKTVGLWRLFLRLKWLALAVYLCFTVTMIYPVFTVKVQSVHNPATRSRIFEPELFIPLAFLFWNMGDLIGRMSPIVPVLARAAGYPRAVFAFSVSRLIFIPMYLACNIRSGRDATGNGAVINSDFFYLFVVQLGFGLTNGFLGSVCMMGAGQYITVDEREAAGGFMSMMLVAGLATGSLLSFFFSES